MKDKTIKEIMKEDKKELNETSLDSFLSTNQNTEAVLEKSIEPESQDVILEDATSVPNEENIKDSEPVSVPEIKRDEPEPELVKPSEPEIAINHELEPIEKSIQAKPKKSNFKKKIKVILLSVFAVVVLSLSGVFVYQYVTNKPEIELNSTKITVECGTVIDYNVYIQSYNATELEIKEIDTNTLGKQIALYKAKNGLISNEKELVIEVVDTKAPEFSLTADTVEIERSEINSFRCYDYIDTSSLKDNHDSFENLKYSCPALADIDEKTNAVMIRYVLSDSSGNESYKELKVIIN